ncbi:MAG: DUF308 domain-containing protein [Rikenellaceae bacterium]|jgi:uncharacterized membrane protein HdeD (DUF308 family)|nr:DUF308 domain-containing protein [Rikenellaceae bacterium]
MNELFLEQLEKSKRAIRNWWLVVALGVLMLAVGVAVFVFPDISYWAMSLIFGVLMLISGLSYIWLAATNQRGVVGRGWVMAGGIIELLLGVILTAAPGITAMTLPLFLGFWLLIRSFALMGVGADMSSIRIRGSGWTMFSGVVLMLFAIIIVMQPLYFGVDVVIGWVGATLVLFGISLCTLGGQLKTLHHNFVR